jgi:hypothetical protein
MNFFPFQQLLSGILGIVLLVVSSVAAEFRVENRVFSEEQTEPVSVSLTLFQEGMVYDFLQKPAETIIYDCQAGRFYLLEMTRRRRSETTTEQIAIFLEQVRQRAKEHPDPAVRFYAAPEFEEHFDPLRRELLLSSPWLTYRLLVISAKNPVQAAAYREFSDASARLNALLDPRARPPFARLKVDEALARRGSLPREVTLIVTQMKNGSPHQTTLHSEHHFGDTLTDSDRAQIAQAQKALNQFPKIDFTKYHKIEQ